MDGQRATSVQGRRKVERGRVHAERTKDVLLAEQDKAEEVKRDSERLSERERGRRRGAGSVRLTSSPQGSCPKGLRQACLLERRWGKLLSEPWLDGSGEKSGKDAALTDVVRCRRVAEPGAGLKGEYLIVVRLLDQEILARQQPERTGRHRSAASGRGTHVVLGMPLVPSRAPKLEKV